VNNRYIRIAETTCSVRSATQVQAITTGCRRPESVLGPVTFNEDLPPQTAGAGCGPEAVRGQPEGGGHRRQGGHRSDRASPKSRPRAGCAAAQTNILQQEIVLETPCRQRNRRPVLRTSTSFRSTISKCRRAGDPPTAELVKTGAGRTRGPPANRLNIAARLWFSKEIEAAEAAVAGLRRVYQSPRAEFPIPFNVGYEYGTPDPSISGTDGRESQLLRRDFRIFRRQSPDDRNPKSRGAGDY